jgi:hypothetical protein
MKFIIIPSSAISIGINNFAERSSLTQVILPGSITRIENCYFSECTSLKKVSFPIRLLLFEMVIFLLAYLFPRLEFQVLPF